MYRCVLRQHQPLLPCWKDMHWFWHKLPSTRSLPDVDLSLHYLVHLVKFLCSCIQVGESATSISICQDPDTFFDWIFFLIGRNAVLNTAWNSNYFACSIVQSSHPFDICYTVWSRSWTLCISFLFLIYHINMLIEQVCPYAKRVVANCYHRNVQEIVGQELE